MKNPFKYSRLVINKAFCNRKYEQDQLLDLIQNSENVLLYSHRKTGKSSLIHKVFRKLIEEKSNIKTIYIDLYGTLSEQDFIDAVFTGLTQIEPSHKRILKAIPGLKMVSSIDPMTNLPTISISSEPSEKKNMLAKAMQTLESYSMKNQLAVALDEFQEISGYSEDGFEKRLRSFIQLHSRISYIFSGSQQHILTQMFNSSKRAFYHSAHSFPLDNIEMSHFVSWAQNLFAEKKIDLPLEAIENITERCCYQPLYIQQFLYELWKVKVIDTKKIDDIENEILQSHRNEYISIFDGLTTNQKKAMKLLAKTDGESIYQTDMLNSMGFKSGSLLSRAIKSLLDKELIVKNGRYRIHDIMFKKWIMAI
ncbi:MAG: hypothetical protein KKD32_03650 [Proteobacteria bacterium]|nr:hypothetical protein [Pseudomonadota bacterium]MBU1586255.1 hypothetical protein [Pseudomonadota bacterium]MBU2453151.1 hypothetical protein [Pseudomonadota bacterium]MBU2630818.1 hypothetical protein [Pseudomonadota bacterium]